MDNAEVVSTLFQTGIPFIDVALRPQELGSDLGIRRLLRLKAAAGESYFDVTPPDHPSLTYRFLQLEEHDVLFRAPPGQQQGRAQLYIASVHVSFTPRDLSGVSIGERYGVLDTADGSLQYHEHHRNRRHFMATKGMLAHADDMAHVSDQLVAAMVARPAYLTGEAFSKVYLDVMGRMYCTDEEAEVPLSVCCQCSLHAAERMKQCPCRQGLFFCSRACQKAHWAAGHRNECTERVV